MAPGMLSIEKALREVEEAFWETGAKADAESNRKEMEKMETVMLVLENLAEDNSVSYHSLVVVCDIVEGDDQSQAVFSHTLVPSGRMGDARVEERRGGDGDGFWHCQDG